jgi:ankyrin repeat protein
MILKVISENTNDIGRFLLAQLYMDSLIGKRSPKALREALQKLPAGSEAYDHAYNDAMERIKGQVADQEDLAIQALSWIVNARRLLTSTELQHALAVEVGEPDLDEDNLPQVEDIVSACAGLVTVDQESAIIRLVHYTTQEYFERTQMRWLPISEAGITFTCVIYLSFDAFRSGPCETDEEFEERLQAYPLYNYAAKNWGHHARNCLLSRGELVDFLKSPALVEASSQALAVVKRRDDYSQLFPKHMTGLHLAACFGLEEAITTLLKEPLGPNLRDDWGRSPLWWAAWAGYTAAVQLFLDGGAEADLKDVDNCTPLSIAAKQGNAAIVQLLLDHGAEVDRKDSEGHTALSWAAREGHLAITQLLLDSGAEVDSQSTCGRTPLSKAAEEGQASMVQLLLDRGAGADSRDIRRRTPLSYAAGNGHMAIVNLLLDKGAEFDLRETGFGLTPLSLAARKGHVGVVEQLLQKGAEVDSKAVFWQGEAPLSRAAAAGHAAVVQLLLDSGAEVDLQDSRGRTALMRAAVLGFVVVVQLLLEKGARIDSKDREGGTPLSLAVDQGQTAVVQLLQAFPPPDQVNPTPPGQALSVPVRDGPRVDDI